MVLQRVGVHFQYLCAQEGFVFVWQHNLVQLPLQVCLKLLLVAQAIMVAEATRIRQHIVCDIVTRIEAIMFIDFLVDDSRNAVDQFILVQRAVQLRQLVVDGRSQREMGCRFPCSANRPAGF